MGVHFPKIPPAQYSAYGEDLYFLHRGTKTGRSVGEAPEPSHHDRRNVFLDDSILVKTEVPGSLFGFFFDRLTDIEGGVVFPFGDGDGMRRRFYVIKFRLDETVDGTLFIDRIVIPFCGFGRILR